MASQLMLGLGLFGLACLIGLGGVYYAPKFMPSPKATTTPKPSEMVVRPSIEPTEESVDPKRPGLALLPPDEIYAKRAVDINQGNPLDPPVNGLLARGILTVFADGKFRPKDPVPRAEFIVWCYNAVMAQTVAGPDPFVSPKKGFPTVNATGEEFKDLPADYWAANVIASVHKTGIFDDILAEHTFRPDAPLTREEWAGFVADLAVAKDVREKLPNPFPVTKAKVAYRAMNYTDMDQIKQEFHLPIFLICSDEKRRGWMDDTFGTPINPGPWGPRKFVTRGEAARKVGFDQHPAD